jgi:hypothetical protein
MSQPTLQELQTVAEAYEDLLAPALFDALTNRLALLSTNAAIGTAEIAAHEGIARFPDAGSMGLARVATKTWRSRRSTTREASPRSAGTDAQPCVPWLPSFILIEPTMVSNSGAYLEK